MEKERIPAAQLLAMIKDAITKDAVLAQSCGDWRPARLDRAAGDPDWRLGEIGRAPPAAQAELRRMCAAIAERYAVDWSQR